MARVPFVVLMTSFIPSTTSAVNGSDPGTVELIDERGPAYEVLKSCDRT